jgi:Tol biopolymer transport system component
VWPLYDFDLVRTVNGETERFLSSDGYDAEATVCMTDGRIVFTSDRDGDLELYSANADGSHLTRLTNTPGYDGGAFFTPDCSEIIWRASRPEGDALTDYQRLLETDLVRPSQLEIFRMNADGTNVVQLTDNGAANFGPYPMPDASGVIFASNVGDSPREFDLFHVGRDGGELEQITYTEQFDGFPMFSPNGEWLVFGSNRGGDDGSTNLFIGRWVE